LYEFYQKRIDMASSNQTNRAGNKNKTGGSYKEKQPAAKPQSGKSSETPVDEDGDGKSDHSMSSQKHNRRIDKR
jgi:flagellar basal body rod protein FlgC